MKRIATAAVMIPVFVWVILFAPFEAFRAALVIVGALAYLEFHQLARACGSGGAVLEPALGIVGGIALLYSPEPTLAILLTAVAAMALALRSQDLKDALPASAALVLGVLYIFGAWRAAVELRAMSAHWLMLAMLLSWAGDTFAFYTGKAIGRHKLAPRISPAKTVEGSVGSVLGAMLAGFLYAHYLIPSATLTQVLVASAVGNVAGQLGDLCESAFKRGAGVKDSGTLLPGHGGWLDRIDSSLFALPVVYACLRWL
jgi:phosphatidate cytidylyltransferase